MNQVEDQMDTVHRINRHKDGVRIMRIMIFWGSILGSPYLGNQPMVKSPTYRNVVRG